MKWKSSTNRIARWTQCKRCYSYLRHVGLSKCDRWGSNKSPGHAPQQILFRQMCQANCVVMHIGILSADAIMKCANLSGERFNPSLEDPRRASSNGEMLQWSRRKRNSWTSSTSRRKKLSHRDQWTGRDYTENGTWKNKSLKFSRNASRWEIGHTHQWTYTELYYKQPHTTAPGIAHIARNSGSRIPIVTRWFHRSKIHLLQRVTGITRRREQLLRSRWSPHIERCHKLSGASHRWAPLPLIHYWFLESAVNKIR